MKNKAEILLKGAVIDVDRAGSVTQAAIFLRPFQMKKECTKL